MLLLHELGARINPRQPTQALQQLLQDRIGQNSRHPNINPTRRAVRRDFRRPRANSRPEARTRRACGTSSRPTPPDLARRDAQRKSSGPGHPRGISKTPRRRERLPENQPNLIAKPCSASSESCQPELRPNSIGCQRTNERTKTSCQGAQPRSPFEFPPCPIPLAFFAPLRLCVSPIYLHRHARWRIERFRRCRPARWNQRPKCWHSLRRRAFA